MAYNFPHPDNVRARLFTAQEAAGYLYLDSTPAMSGTGITPTVIGGEPYYTQAQLDEFLVAQLADQA